MRQTGSRGLLSADTSRWDDRALPLLLNTLIIKWSPEGKKIDEGADTERTTLTGPVGRGGRASFRVGAKVVAAWISYLKGTTENSIFPLYSCIISTFSDLFHSPAIKLFQFKLVKTGLDWKRAELLFSLLNTQKLIRQLRNLSEWNKRYFLVKVFIRKFVNFLVFRQRWSKTRRPRINCPNSSRTDACF